MNADLLGYLDGKGGKRPAIALDVSVMPNALGLLNLINEANDYDPSREIELAISAIGLAKLKRRWGARFEIWQGVLRAKNVVVKSFDEADAIVGAAPVGARDVVTPDELICEQFNAEGSLLVTRNGESEPGESVLHASIDEAHAAAELVVRSRTAARRVREPGCALDARIEALATLVETNSEDLPTFLADELERSGLVPAWRDALISAVEHTQVTEVALRARVVTSLLRHARALRDQRSEGPLWSAVRRYASMVPVEASDTLLEFLQPDDAMTTKQVALQGVFNIYSHEAPHDCSARDRLRARVRELAEEYIDREFAQTPERIALAHTCFRAAAALDDPSLDELFARIEKLGLRRITERAATLRDELTARRARAEA